MRNFTVSRVSQTSHCMSTSAGVKSLPSCTLPTAGTCLMKPMYTSLVGRELVGPAVALLLPHDAHSQPLQEACAPVQEVGKQHTKAALISDLLFASTFFVCRLQFGPVVVYKTLRCRSSHRVVKWGGAGVQGVSLFLSYRIVQARRLETSRLLVTPSRVTLCKSSASHVRRRVRVRPEPSGKRGRVADMLHGPLLRALLALQAPACLCQRFCFLQLLHSP